MLENIKLPEELKSLSIDSLRVLCSDIRREIINNVSINGGHLSSNLGVVELTTMIHYVFNLPNDKLLFDVTHQCYTHKILSGRKLDTLRQLNGISGFYSREESNYDCYLSGHSSTSISTGLGMATARDMNNDNHEVIVVIGDASLANGVAMEGVNNLLSSHSKVILIVNDNGMSISKTVGGLSKVLRNIKSSKAYQNGKRRYRNMFNRGKIRRFFFNISCKIKNFFKRLFYKETFLENLGVDYIGVIDGHNLEKLHDALSIAKSNDKSIIVHVKTIKGYGCDKTINDEEGKWHGVGKFDLTTFDMGEPKVSFDDIVCDYLCDNADNKNLAVITPAMKSGSRLEPFFEKHKSRSFDVGISEEHAFVFASGLALNGVVPYISVYSTFMQRSYDFINQDLVRNKSKCVVGVEGAGLVGEDGESHHGIFDVSLVNHLPNTMICMPIYCNDINPLLDICFKYDYLSFIRLPKNKCYISNSDSTLSYGKWNYLHKGENSKTVVLSVGPITVDLISEIKNKHFNIDVIGVYFIKPLDEEMLKEIAKEYTRVIIYDVYSVKEGLYLPILEFYNKNKININIEFYGLENIFYKHGKWNELLKEYKLDVISLIEYVNK